ncbi:hypothetical protein C6P45_002179 [Maudiozyma exigua]|uniref:Uncharacterized protein n=1 Tax=Maudiozyma exigua TaxID=34358 RepID=A0A9P6VZW9_MAUEX|nr:hypothetical protein C6P45_002179 [Kazachstania exigua]
METELANLHISENKEGRRPSLISNSNSNSNPNMVRIRRKSSNISRTNSNTMFPPVPPSPTISEHSLIFERSVEDLTTLPSSSANTLGSMTNLTMLTKQRSNSNVLLQRQLTGGSVNSITSNLMTPMMLPVSATASNSSNNNNTRNANHHHHHRRRTIENLVAPALDASCSLIADQNTQIDNVNVIHSRNSSIVGLNMALGLSRSSSINNTLNKRDIMNGTSTTTATATGQSDMEDDQDDDSGSESDTDQSDIDGHNNSSSNNKHNKNANNTYFSMCRSSSSRRSSRSNTTSTQTSPRFSATGEPGKVLKFYSYVDMVSDEHINPAISNRRPSFLSGSVSSPLLTPSELLNSSASNHSMSPPSQLQTPTAGGNFLKSPVLSANKRDQQQQQPYLSPPLSSRRLSGNISNINNNMPRSPTYNIGSGMIATSPPTFQRGNRRTTKLKKNDNSILHNNDIKFQIDSSDEFSSDDDDDDTELFSLEQSQINKNKTGGNTFINIQNPRQANTTTTSSLKTSMFQTGNNNSNSDVLLKNKSRTYSNASYHPPNQTSRPGSTSGNSFRKLSIPVNNTNSNAPMVAITSTSPVLPSPYSLQIENLGDVLRQKVSDSQPASRSSTPVSKET